MGSLNMAMKKGLFEDDKIICLIDDLSNGPINNMSDIDKRVTWQKEYYKDYHTLKQLEFNYYNFHNDIKNLGNEDIYIWYGENSMEMCGLFYALSLMQDRINNIYTINVSKEIHGNNNTKIKHSCVGEISPERLKWFIDKKENLEVIIINQHMNLWLELKQIDTNLRINVDKKIISVQEDYFDEMIMYYTKDIFTSCGKILGDIFNHIKDCYLSDSYIFWRILELIKVDKIACSGNIGNIKEMKIKRV
jgi:hypothetical protein